MKFDIARLIWQTGLGLLLAACATTPPAPTAGSLPTPAVVTQGTALATDAAAPTATPPPPTLAPTPAATRLVELRGLEPRSLDGVLTTASTSLGWSLEPAQDATATVVAGLAQSGVEVVVINGQPAEGDICGLAARLPSAYVIAVEAAGCQPAPANLLLLGGPESREDQAGFLAGMVAGFASGTERVAVFADTTTPAGRKHRNGFLSGVRYTCPRCRLDTIDLAGTEAVEFAAAEAVKYVSLGADVFFAAAGPAGEAALRAAAAAGGWVIGSGGDVFVTVFEAGTLAGADRVLTSAYVDLGGALTQVLSAYAAGQPPTGALPLTLANAGVVLAPYRHSEGALSPLDVQDVEQARLRLAERSLETGVDPLTGDER